MRRILLFSGLSLVLVATGLHAWWSKGHGTIAEAAAIGLPDSMPAFFRAAGKHFAHFAADPDRWKNRQTTFLKASEEANHFLDSEYLEGKALPPDRYQAIELFVKLHHKPDATGMLPYAIMEWYERLMVGFRDLRREPDNESIRMKCLVYAGTMSHYTGDCVMPLHTTKDYDGKRRDGGGFQQKGIHAKIDSFPENNGFTAEELSRGLKAAEIKDVWAYVQQHIKDSYTHIDKCYEIDKAGGFTKPTAENRAFILERCREGAQFTMDLWYTAWMKSTNCPAPY